MSDQEPTPHCADCSWANGEIYKHSRNCRWLSLESTLQRQAKEIERLREALADYGCHGNDCILSKWSAGRPTPEGGYETMYGGKWYQSRPVDETPKCGCGYEEALSAKAGE